MYNREIIGQLVNFISSRDGIIDKNQLASQVQDTFGLTQDRNVLALRTKSWTGNCQISPNLRLYSIGLKP